MRRDVSKLTKKISKLKEQKKKGSNSEGPVYPLADEVEDDDESVSNEIEDVAAAIIDVEIENLREQADALWESCKKHAVDTNYGHYIQLQIGLMSFYSALLKLLSPNSKRPHGKLEFVFNNAI